MNDKKLAESNCYEQTKLFIGSRVSAKVRKYINSVFPINNGGLLLVPSERPDFVANYEDRSYILEHFMIDYCYDGPSNNQSQSHLENRKMADIYKKYHDPEIGTIRDSDMDAAIIDIEKEVNSLSNVSLSFDYGKFVDGFSRVFGKHYEQVNQYRMNELINHSDVKTGFLIEFHCDTSLMYAIKNKSIVSFSGGYRPFPMTKDIVEIIKSAVDLDYVLISQFNEGVPKEAKCVRIYEPNNIERSIEVQRIDIYDQVLYSDIRRNITLERSQEEE